MDDGGSRHNQALAQSAAGEDELDPAVEQFINSFGLFFEAYGISRIGGRMMGLLLVSAQPLAAEAMANKLKVSRASISMNIRMLLAAGIAERAHISGDRRDFYCLPSSGMEPILKANIDATIAMGRLAEQGLNAIGPHHPARREMEEFATLIQFCERYFATMIDDWRKYKATLDRQRAAVNGKEQQDANPERNQ